LRLKKGGVDTSAMAMFLGIFGASHTAMVEVPLSRQLLHTTRGRLCCGHRETALGTTDNVPYAKAQGAILLSSI
jgi:hypothetical protein